MLVRARSDDQGTWGMLYLPGGDPLYTLELPDRGNRRQLSRIPAGEYRCSQVRNSKFGWVYGLSGVPGRSGILIHSGNLAGDVEKGLISHSHGCILVGTYLGSINRQRAVLASKPAVAQLHRRMNNEPFRLWIQDETR